MRKKIIEQDSDNPPHSSEKWLDVRQIARVEITSEQAAYPIENALALGSVGNGWRASKTGKQIIRIIFDEPQRVNNIHLLIEDKQQARTQELLLLWSPNHQEPLREIVRQQYNFNPETSTRELENYTVNLEGVKMLELQLDPDSGRGTAYASISNLWVG